MSTRVVIPQRLRTSETLQQRVGGEHHVLDLLDTAVLSAGYRGDVLHDAFRGLGLASARLARNNNALIILIGLHVVVRRLCNRKDVWWDL